MELNYYEIQVLNELTKYFDIFIVLSFDEVLAKLEYENCFMEPHHNLYYMRIKKLEEI